MEMSVVAMLWMAWFVVIGATGLLYAYRMSLTKDEEDQLFLDDAFSHEKAIQARILSKVAQVQPMIRAAQVLSVLMTLVVLGYYGWLAMKALGFV